MGPSGLDVQVTVRLFTHRTDPIATLTYAGGSSRDLIQRLDWPLAGHGKLANPCLEHDSTNNLLTPVVHSLCPS